MSLKINELFTEFSPVSYQQWKQKVQYELKGEDYNQTLTWESPEGIRVNPIYFKESEFPKTESSTGFDICQELFVHDIEKTVRRANSSLKRGADSLRLHIPNQEISLQELLGQIEIENINLFLKFDHITPQIASEIKSLTQGKAKAVFILIDPIHTLAKTGNWIEGADNFELLKACQNEFPEASFISINSNLYQQAGANHLQQITFAIAHALEYLNRFQTNQPIVFEVAVGSDYFFEIAKIRALKQVFELVASEFNHTAGCHIFATPSKRNLTLYDYNVNMLRTTTACMSAVLGGAQTLSNLAYDTVYHKSNEFGDRISRNQLLVLKHESYFNEVGQAADGSYYIENLTQILAEKALAAIKKLEAEGGFLEHLKNGSIQKEIKQQADWEQSAFDSGKIVLLGSNKYPDPSNKMSGDLELFPFVKKKAKNTLIVPIVEKRLAEEYEKARLEKEETPNS